LSSLTQFTEEIFEEIQHWFKSNKIHIYWLWVR